MTLKTIQECLAHNLRTLRTAKGMSQAQVSEATGVAIASIKLIETQKRWIGLDTVDKLAKLYGVSSVALFQVPKDGRKRLV